MKEQKKSTSKVIVRSALILLLLTLISGCFLGSTFARYVSKGEGDLSAGVAEWKIDVTMGDTEGDGQSLLGTDVFSPNMAKYDSTTDRSRSVEVTLLTIVNNGAVDAYVKVDIASAPVGYDYSDVLIDFNSETNRNEGEVDYFKPYKESFDKIFTMSTPSYSITGDGTKDNGPIDNEGSEYDEMYLLEAGETLTVTANIIWTTDLDTDATYTPDEIGCVWSDYRDTWIGENVKTIGWAYSWYALQGSEAPASGATNSPASN